MASTFIVEIYISLLWDTIKMIVSDCDCIFISNFCQILFKFFGIYLYFSNAHHPEIDNQTKVTKIGTSPFLKIWLKFLLWAMFSHNTSLHFSIGISPFKLFMNCSLHQMKQWLSNFYPDHVHEWLLQCNEILWNPHCNLKCMLPILHETPNR